MGWMLIRQGSGERCEQRPAPVLFVPFKQEAGSWTSSASENARRSPRVTCLSCFSPVLDWN